MARTRAPRKQAASERTPQDRLIDAALALAARQRWRRTGLAEIAAEAGLTLPEAYGIYRSKAAILRAFSRRADAAALAGAGTEAEESTRERLFDTLMRRFDALKPHREGLRAILRDSVGHPGLVLRLPALGRSMTWMMEASGISTAGCRGRIAAHLLTALYISVLRDFLADDTDDLSRTMAALDRGLRRGEQLCRWGRRERPEAAEAHPAT